MALRRATFLRDAVRTLDLDRRVTVVAEAAEEVGRQVTSRGAFDVVVARSFGPPAVAAECAAPLLAVGGVLLVSEPPDDDPARWPAAPLAELGLADEGRRGGVRRLRQVAPPPADVPRRAGVPGRRPRW